MGEIIPRAGATAVRCREKVSAPLLLAKFHGKTNCRCSGIGTGAATPPGASVRALAAEPWRLTGQTSSRVRVSLRVFAGHVSDLSHGHTRQLGGRSRPGSRRRHGRSDWRWHYGSGAGRARREQEARPAGRARDTVLVALATAAIGGGSRRARRESGDHTVGGPHHRLCVLLEHRRRDAPAAPRA